MFFTCSVFWNVLQTLMTYNISRQASASFRICPGSLHSWEQFLAGPKPDYSGYYWILVSLFSSFLVSNEMAFPDQINKGSYKAKSCINYLKAIILDMDIFSSKVSSLCQKNEKNQKKVAARWIETSRTSWIRLTCWWHTYFSLLMIVIIIFS